MTIIALEHERVTDKYLKALYQLQTHLNLLQHGIIAEGLIPYATMQTAMENIIKQLQLHHPLLSMVKDTPQAIYAGKHFTIVPVKQQIFLTVYVPLTPMKRPLTVYKILDCELPTADNTTHVTKFLDLPKYIAYDEQQEQYLEWQKNRN